MGNNNSGNSNGNNNQSNNNGNNDNANNNGNGSQSGNSGGNSNVGGMTGGDGNDPDRRYYDRRDNNEAAEAAIANAFKKLFGWMR